MRGLIIFLHSKEDARKGVLVFFPDLLGVTAPAALKRFAAGKTLKWAGFTSAHLNQNKGPPRGLPRGAVYSMAIITAGLCND